MIDNDDDLGNDINSVAGVLKLYLRELREPIFSVQYFDQFMELASKWNNFQILQKLIDNPWYLYNCFDILCFAKLLHNLW